MEEKGGLPNRDEVFEEALTAIDESRIRQGIEGSSKTQLVACECLEILSDDMMG